MIKKIVTFSLFIFVSGLTGIVMAGFLVAQQKCGTALAPGTGLLGESGNSAATSTSGQVSPGGVVLSSAEVSKHNSGNDCWQIINGKVYSLSSYLNQHPGGAETIIPYCGKEATAAFSNKGNQGSNHSDFAWQLLDKYLVGSLGQGMPSSTSSPGSSQAAPKAPAGAVKPGLPDNNPAVAATKAGDSISLSAAEAAKHNTAKSCWLVVSGKIYDVSSYLSKHPAGAGAITPYCGKEATAVFSGTGGGHVHSSYAWGLLGSFYIGAIGQSTTASTIQQNAAGAQAAAQQAPSGEDDEDD